MLGIGANDVNRHAPGVYFVEVHQAAGYRMQTDRKDIISHRGGQMKKLLLLYAVGCWLSAAAADSLNCRLVGQCTPGYAFGVAVSGNYAYVAVGMGLRVILVSDPAHPTEVGSCACLASGVAVSGNYAYIADHDTCLRIISVSDPAHPSEIGHCNTPDYAYGVAVAGNYAYVADNSAGLRVISVSDPVHPTEVGHCNMAGSACDVAVNGSHAYVAGGPGGLRVITVSDPTHPTEVGSCTCLAIDVVVSGDYAYVADQSAGLRVISVSDPAHPTEVGHCNMAGYAHGVDTSGDFAYVADDTAGLRVISVSDPAHPTEVGYYDTPGEAYGVAVAGDYAYVADGSGGLQIIQFYGGGVEETPSAEVRKADLGPTIVHGVLFLPDAVGGKRLAVGARLLDISGRKVLDLRPGANDVRALAAGVYFVLSEPTAVSRRPPAVTKVIVSR